MAQFDVYHNTNPRTRADIPYLLDIQSDLLHELDTCLVVPLFCSSASPQSFTRLTPEITFSGERYFLMTPMLAGIARKDLGSPCGNLGQYRNQILAAWDLLLAGF